MFVRARGRVHGEAKNALCAQILDMIAEVDSDKSGQIDFDEFLQARPPNEVPNSSESTAAWHAPLRGCGAGSENFWRTPRTNIIMLYGLRSFSQNLIWLKT